MSTRVLIAAELRELLGDDPLPGCLVSWLPEGQSVPGGDFVAVLSLLIHEIGAAQLEKLPELKVVANCAVGVDNIDVVRATERGITVTNTPDVLTDATADLTWTLILAVARRVKEGMQLMAENNWRGWHPTLLLGLELKRRTLGLLGAGRIGQAVGRRAGGFGMRVIYNSTKPKPEFEQGTEATYVDLPRLLRESDVLSLHVPLTSLTQGIISRDRLAGMKEGSILINTSRGELVDEEALLEALEAGRLAGAGLDVYSDEPNVSSVLTRHPRVVALPHVGSATWDTRRAMAALALANINAVLTGKPALTPVSR